MSGDWLIIGLGNPGEQYAHTRHNVGFDVIDLLSQSISSPSFKEKFGGHYALGKVASSSIVLLKPQTFMNKSGEPAQSFVRFFKISTEQIIVIHDELDFEPGVVKLKKSGGPGGHNGLRSLIQHIGPDFIRIRVGVGKPSHAQAGASYVLSKPNATESKLMQRAMSISCQAVELILKQGFLSAVQIIHQP